MRRVQCQACGVKNEQLDFLSNNTHFTLRFARQIGGLCRAMTIRDVARRMPLDWQTVKELDKIYMREQLRRARPLKPKVIGSDEISIKKRHIYRIVVSDLEKQGALWFGGNGRREKNIDIFYAFLGKNATQKIRLAVMYKSEAWTRKFFDNWKTQLRGQRLKPYEKFAQTIEKHWSGIAAYCKPENKVALGFVEGLNNKIRVIQRRAYGLRDEEYLKLKILTVNE